MLVDGTAELQYCIQLAVAGMEDGPPSSMSPAERLDKLRQYMTAWDALEWGPNETIEMSAGNLWELYGGVLAQCVSDGGIKLRQLPSDHRCIKSDIWFVETLGIHVRDFTMDPSQDLLVLIENPTWQ
jgi:hypothetical protein